MSRLADLAAAMADDLATAGLDRHAAAVLVADWLDDLIELPEPIEALDDVVLRRAVDAGLGALSVWVLDLLEVTDEERAAREARRVARRHSRELRRRERARRRV